MDLSARCDRKRRNAGPLHLFLWALGLGATVGAALQAQTYAVASQAPPSAAASESPTDPCAIHAQLTSIQSSSAGLIVQANAPITARIITAESLAEKGFAGFSQLTVEIPGAVLAGVPNRMEFESGLFSSVRIVRFRSETDCGLRLRLQTNVVATWIVQERPEGVLITPQELPQTRERAEPPGQMLQAESGSLRLGGSHSLTTAEGARTLSSSQLQLGFVHLFPSIGTVRGFISDIQPRGRTGAPYGALGLAGVRLPGLLADLAAGDIIAIIGDTGLSQGSAINSILIRGGGVALLGPAGIGLHGFGGRAASSALRRIPGTTGVISEISRDDVFGVQVNWQNSARSWGVALGATESAIEDAADRLNVVEAFETDQRRYRLRLVLEQSKEQDGDQWGYAFTVEPRANAQNFGLGGYYRYISAGFLPPAGSNFFAGVRRSYSLYGSYKPWRNLTTTASLGQTKTFSLFDPPDVGTLSSTRSVGFGYELNPSVSLAADYSEAELETDRGAILPADSLTSRMALSASLRFGETGASARFSHEATENRINPEFGLDSNRLDLDLFHPLSDSGELLAYFRYADSERADGTTAGENYAASLGFRYTPNDYGSLRGDLGYAITPAGVAASEFRQSYASIGFQTGTAIKIFQGGVQLTFQRLEIQGQSSRDAGSILMNASRLFEWGIPPTPHAPFYTRAMPLFERDQFLLMASVVIVRVFEDANNDGTQDASEPGVPGLVARVNRRIGVTNNQGRFSARVTEGLASVELQVSAAAVDVFAERTSAIVAVPRVGSVEVNFGLRPAGRVLGRVVFQGELVEPAVLQGIRIVERGVGFRRDTVTDDSGAFRFGVTPIGPCTVEIDPATLAPDTVIVGPSAIPVSISKGEREEVIFTIRRATARERLIGPPTAQAAPPPAPTEAQRAEAERREAERREAESIATAQEALREGRLDEAFAIFARLAVQDDLPRAALLDSAKGFTQLEEFDEALQAFRRAGPLQPAEELYQFYYAVTLYELGQYGEAKRQLRAALPHIERTEEVARYETKIEGAIE